MGNRYYSRLSTSQYAITLIYATQPRYFLSLMPRLEIGILFSSILSK